MISDIVDIIHGLSNLNWAVSAWVYAVIGCFIYICLCIVKLVYNLIEHLFDYHSDKRKRQEYRFNQRMGNIKDIVREARNDN